MARSPDKLDKNWMLLFLCWVVVAGSTLGSLFFSEVMGLPPCALCWYQRIFMYPLAVILLVGLFPFDVRVVRYALPIAVLGGIFALYHTLLQIGVIPESAAPCQQGVSCSSVDIELLGFLSIPLMSLLAFCVIIGLLIAVRRRTQ